MQLNLDGFQRTLCGLLRLNHYFKVRRRVFATVILSALGAALLEGLGIGLLMPMLELLRTSVPEKPMKAINILMDWIPGRSASFYTITLCLIVVCSIGLKNLFLYVGSNAAAGMRATALLNLRDVIFRRMLHADLAVYEKHTSGELASVITHDSGATAYSIEYLVFLFQRVAMAACYVVVMLFISWELSLLSALLAVMCGSALGFAYRRLTRAGQELGEANQEVSSHLIEALSATKLIRTTNSQEREIANFYRLNETSAAIQKETVQATALLTPITETIGVIGGMIIIASAAVLLVQPGYMKGEALMGFAFLLIRLMPLLTQIYHLYGQTLSLVGNVERAERWLVIPQFPQQPFGARSFQGIENGIQIRGLEYRYPNGTIALRNIDLDIEAGTTVALVGGSGSGKSTLAAILQRLRQPSAGQILVDGIDYWEFSPASWHSQVSAVEQEAFLFHASLKENIRYGYPSASDADVTLAIRKAHLEHVIEELPQGLDTIVGERGATLSGGQRQRMSIARALVRNPKLLILDEATSALDSVSEVQVQAALEEAQQGRTAIVIAHRFSTIRNADKIVVLEEGRVVEQGSWDELEKRQGAFYHLLNATQKALV